MWDRCIIENWLFGQNLKNQNLNQDFSFPLKGVVFLTMILNWDNVAGMCLFNRVLEMEIVDRRLVLLHLPNHISGLSYPWCSWIGEAVDLSHNFGNCFYGED